MWHSDPLCTGGSAPRAPVLSSVAYLLCGECYHLTLATAQTNVVKYVHLLESPTYHILFGLVIGYLPENDFSS